MAILKEPLSLFLLLISLRPAWIAAASPLEGKLVFFGNTVDGRQRIESSTLNATQLQTVLEVPPGEYVLSGQVSPDARRLAFTSVVDASDLPALWIRDHDGERKKLADNVTSVQAWSPDGLTIAGYHGDASGRFTSFKIDVATGRRTKIVLPETDWIDDWSPDGQTLLATRGNPTRSVTRADGEIYPLRGLISLTISGTRSVPITTDTEGDFIWPRFSPNGRQIAYYARHHRDGKTAEYAVVAASDGAQPRELVCFTSLEAEDVVKPHGPPCWSPDGMTILFKVTKRPRKQASANLLRFEVVAIAADGTGVRRTPLGTERSWWGFIDCRKRTLRQCRQPFFCPQSLPRFAHLPPSFSTLPSLTDIPSITAVRGADSDPTAPG